MNRKDHVFFLRTAKNFGPLKVEEKTDKNN